MMTRHGRLYAGHPRLYPAHVERTPAAGGRVRMRMNDMQPPGTGPTGKVIDVKTFWRTLGQRAIGSTIVTARGEDGPAGFLGLSASHICADPPLMLVSIDKRTSALAAVLKARHFAVNFLPSDAAEIADMFGGKGALKGAARFETARWQSL